MQRQESEVQEAARLQRETEEMRQEEEQLKQNSGGYWVVSWMGAGEKVDGEKFASEVEARAKLDQLNGGSCPARLYNPDQGIADEYSWATLDMGKDQWAELDQWAAANAPPANEGGPAEQPEEEKGEAPEAQVTAAELEEIAKEDEKHIAHLQEVLDSVDKLEAYTRQLAESQTQAPADEARTLEEVLAEREKELALKYEELAQADVRDEDLSKAFVQLQLRPAREISEMRTDRDQRIRAMGSAWARERQALCQIRDATEAHAKELAWHVNRGSHIKPLKADPRVPSGLIGHHDPHEHDNRLLCEEQQLLKEHSIHVAHLDDQEAQKIQVARTRDATAANWDTPLKPGQVPVEGTRQWYDAEIARLKARVSKEERSLKGMVEQNYRLKEDKKGVENTQKELRKTIVSKLITQQRPASTVAPISSSQGPSVRTRTSRPGVGRFT